MTSKLFSKPFVLVSLCSLLLLSFTACKENTDKTIYPEVSANESITSYWDNPVSTPDNLYVTPENSDTPGETPDFGEDDLPDGGNSALNPDDSDNKTDVDTDGDGTENNNDTDIDGDGIKNNEDDDIDGDDIPNDKDDDIDGDDIPNDEDDLPTGKKESPIVPY